MDKIIFSYSTKQAVKDGSLIAADKAISEDAGVKYPVFFSSASWSRYVEVPKNMKSFQNINGRLWDILYMFALNARKVNTSRMLFCFVCQLPAGLSFLPNEENSGDGEILRGVILKAVIGPTDIDNPEPAIFIMFPDED